MPFDPSYQSQIQDQQGAKIVAYGPQAVIDMSQVPAANTLDSTANTLTAHAGGGQGSALPVTAEINQVTTVASAGDSVVLPAAAAGIQIMVANAAAVNSMNVFPASGDQINALGANTAFALAAGKTAQFYCVKAGQWHSILSA